MTRADPDPHALKRAPTPLDHARAALARLVGAYPGRRRPAWITGAVVAALSAVPAAPVQAQEERPIGRYVVDVRGALAIYGQDPVIAETRGVLATTLPSRGLGISIGGQVYPLRWKALTFGVGAELLSTSGETEAARASDGISETVRVEFVSLTPQFSLNFGHRMGWSYLSGGMGSSRFSVLGDSIPEAEVEPKPKTINYGGGGRWFTREHLAFTFDLRFYAMSPVSETAETPPTPRMTILVLSIGASFR